MSGDNIARALSHAKRRFIDDGHVYQGYFFQQEWEALGEAISILYRQSELTEDSSFGFAEDGEMKRTSQMITKEQAVEAIKNIRKADGEPIGDDLELIWSQDAIEAILNISEEEG